MANNTAAVATVAAVAAAAAMETDLSQPSQQHLSDLIQSLEQATSMAKQLSLSSTTTDHNTIFSSLTSAHLSLSSFLAAADNSDDEPMIAADDDGGDGGGGGCDGGGGEEDEEEEMNSRDLSMEKVEEKMRELLNVKCKRLKRAVSPSSVVAEERRRLEERENGRVLEVFDPIGTKLRNLDLIFQFHA